MVELSEVGELTRDGTSELIRREEPGKATVCQWKDGEEVNRRWVIKKNIYCQWRTMRF